ncbi:MAG TPA: TonB-dependent receptor [Edaphocola sp.]|nr:TonB-dependent receptor [Edaphocola sp.]
MGFLKNYFLFLLSFVVSLPFYSIAQNSFEDTLADITIISKKLNFNQDLKSEFNSGQITDTLAQNILKLYHNLSVANLLSQQAPIFIKSYGVNNMASVSFRGASAAQSLVLWKGVPLNNPSLGIADISTLQTGMFDNISIQYGGNASLLGSGNIGGALYLDNQVIKRNKPLIALGLGMGSFGRKEASLNTQWSYKKLNIGLKAIYQDLKNDFSYDNINGDSEIMTNARLKAKGLILSSNYKLSPYQSISFDFWYQDYFRQIPKAMFEANSSKQQNDDALRTLLNWEYQKKNINLYAKFSLNTDKLDYSDPFYNIFNKSKTQQYYQELGWKQNFKIANFKSEHTILVFSAFQYVRLLDRSTNVPFQSKPAVAAAYQYFNGNKKWAIQVNARQEWLNNNLNPSLFGSGTEYQIIKQDQWNVKLKASVQKTYRLPTLNELYNKPGGNENLKPEQGWNKELATIVLWHNNKGNISIRQQSNYFNRSIKDWIYWLGGAIWTPHNLAKVYNRGIETSNDLNFYLKENTKFYFSLKTAYTLSTTLESYMPNDSSINKQIPYAPRYTGNINLGFNIQNWNFNYNHNYTGFRFITTDESIYLKPYHTGNLQLAYIFYFKKISATLNLQIQNLWNEQYQIVAYRPMPNRFFNLGTQISF